MTDDFQLFPDAPDRQANNAAPGDADLALITAYLAGELTHVQSIAVDNRLATDARFLANVRPVIEAWLVPGSFGTIAHQSATTHAPRKVPLTRAEIDAGWQRHLVGRESGAGSPRAAALTPRPRRVSLSRIAAVISLIVLPIVATAQFVMYTAHHADAPGHEIAQTLVAPFRPAATPRPVGVVGSAVVGDERRSAQPVTLTPRAQGVVPPRPLGRVVATSAPRIGDARQARQLPSGLVLVNDPGRRQLYLLDSALTHPAVLFDSAGGAAGGYPGLARPQTYPAFVAFRGDSILFPLVGRGPFSFLVLDRSLVVKRTIETDGAQFPWGQSHDGWERWVPGLGLVHDGARPQKAACVSARSSESQCPGLIISVGSQIDE